MVRCIVFLISLLCITSALGFDGYLKKRDIGNSEIYGLKARVENSLAVGVGRKKVELFLSMNRFTLRFETDKRYFGEDRDELPNLDDIKGRYIAKSQYYDHDKISSVAFESFLYLRIYIGNDDNVKHLHTSHLLVER